MEEGKAWGGTCGGGRVGVAVGEVFGDSEVIVGTARGSISEVSVAADVGLQRGVEVRVLRHLRPPPSPSPLLLDAHLQRGRGTQQLRETQKRTDVRQNEEEGQRSTRQRVSFELMRDAA